MESQQDDWNKYYSNRINYKEDNWLEKYKSIFTKYNPCSVYDLGCGNGNNIDFLINLNINIFASDYSEEAIDQVHKRFNINAECLDMRNPFPIANDSFDIVISDLSIHYFSQEKTIQILNEIHRILKNKGTFLARVNSIEDTNHGFGVGKTIERNYFYNDGKYKRFFDEADIKYFFGPRFNILNQENKETSKYDKVKKVWEVIAEKKCLPIVST